MANMSYCRWHNTRLDVMDCLEAYYDAEDFSKEEHRSAKRLFEAVCEFLENEGVIEEYDLSYVFNHLDMMLED